MAAPSIPSRGTRLIRLRRGELRLDAVFAFVTVGEFEHGKDSAGDFLSESEFGYFSSLQFPRRQQSYLLGRLAAKLAAGEYLREPGLNRIEIYPGVFEQPLVKYLSDDVPGVSISHCEGLAVAVAFPAGHPMAIDVEAVDVARVATMKSQMTAHELRWAQCGEAAEDSLCALVWTAKEALSKVLRCGLMSPMEIMALSELKRGGGGLWEGLFQNFAQYRFVSWVGDSSVLSLVLPKNSIIASGLDASGILPSPG
ncbi:MAG: 4'-phosphopantetheinyl transferase family protein [Limisphaerales bacterium]